jgi:predicted transcriptional regulator
VIGILTERDIVRSISEGVQPEKIIAGSLMSRPIFSIRNDQRIEEAARLMIKNMVRHLLVEDAYHGAVGIITTTDLARYRKQKIQQESPTEGQHESSDLSSEVWELFF